MDDDNTGIRGFPELVGCPLIEFESSISMPSAFVLLKHRSKRAKVHNVFANNSIILDFFCAKVPRIASISHKTNTPVLHIVTNLVQ